MPVNCFISSSSLTMYLLPACQFFLLLLACDFLAKYTLTKQNAKNKGLKNSLL